MSEEIRKLLIVEDDPGLQSQLRWSFDHLDVIVAGDRNAALAALEKHQPAVVTLDLGLPPDAANASEGLVTLEQILAKRPQTKVIVVTGNDDRANAVRAVGLGAYDFYQKPIDPDILRLIVDRAYRFYQLEEENRRLMEAQGGSPLSGVMTSSPQMLKVCRTIEKVAPTDATTLLLGESGTGKELLARAVHELSPRKSGRFVAINCGAIPETLLESELFGYEKGAFTGAAKQTLGKIEYADGGTLFLDEVGDLPMPLQVKLLRFLQERVIERLGGRKEVPVDVRVVCATHQDIPTLVRAGNFREDLYYRISEITVRIPGLREREGDALLLARTFLDRYNKQVGRSIKGFTRDAIAAIESHPWPGNVRELENKVKRAVIMVDGTHIDAEALELAAPAEAENLTLNLREIRDSAERAAVQRALSLFNGNISQAAEALGVSRPTIYDLMNKFKLKS